MFALLLTLASLITYSSSIVYQPRPRWPGSFSYDAEDADDKFRINLHEITKIAGQVAQIGGVLGFDAEDLDDCYLGNNGEIVCQKGTNWMPRGLPRRKSLTRNDAEDVDNKFKLGKIVNFARKAAQIGKVLGYDAEDADDRKITVRIRPAVPIGYDAEDTDDKLKLGKIVDFARKAAEIGKVLGYDAEDIYHARGYTPIPGLRKRWHAEDVDDRKINWSEITKIAGQIGEIGGILGYDAEDVDDKKLKIIKLNQQICGPMPPSFWAWLEAEKERNRKEKKTA